MATGQRLALVTGAAGDIGMAIARRLGTDGRRLVLCDLDSERIRSRVAEAGFARDPLSFALDLRDPGAVDAFARDVAAHGTVDILVNNAAFQHDGDVIRASLEDFDDSYAVNLRAPFLLSKAFAPGMRNAGGGAIVNIASVHALAAGPGRAAYATMKAGLLGLTRSMAADLGRHNIRVNAIIPTATRTSALERSWSQERGMSAGVRTSYFDWASGQHPMGRIAEAEDIAEAVKMLAVTSFISGESIRVDGGLLSSLRLLPPQGN
ncbi:SDR family oxidoreductase [Chelativorans sp. AA-79]|uniref:SDR family NAD(P)-dependent oxidoreductase n=1 Tax=Chelativorans sp. AA-79 TaxID=3028735 RepID=UPI0023F7F6EB|nr:SDR family oxidoreductase [Chelativorans sp. AA-79]WEX12428.1 SDR family NAD(P)-dependent oxidoreductase [Chelativorans sp. AA-79]